jgi:hypothetical protein
LFDSHYPDAAKILCVILRWQTCFRQLMKPMKTLIVPRFVLVCGCALFLLTPAFAEPTPRPGPIDPTTGLPLPPQPPEAWQKKCPKDISFDGLPLGEVTKLLREYFPESNFLVDQDVENEPIHIEQLRNVTLEDILTAIELSTKNSVRAAPVNDRIVHLSSALSQEKPKTVCRTFNLSNYLLSRSDPNDQALALADLEDALKTCWKLLAQAESNPKPLPEPVMSMHKATRLLIVAGTSEQLDTVAQVVSQLDPYAGMAAPGFLGQHSRGGETFTKPGSSSTNKPASGR